MLHFGGGGGSFGEQCVQEWDERVGRTSGAEAEAEAEAEEHGA